QDGLLVGHRAVRVVAGRAAHLALDQGHVAGLADLSLLLGVALVADLGLAGLGEQGRLAAVGLLVVHAVAGDAGDVFSLVHAAEPVHALAAGVAGGAQSRDFGGLHLLGV